MRVPIHIVEARRERLAALIERHRYLPVRELCAQLGVSEATARRDLAALARLNKVKRTHGGALAEFNERFPSFNERQRSSSKGKHLIGATAAAWIHPGGTYFLDSGTTIFALAEAFRDAPKTPVTIVTSNLPAGEILAAIEGLTVYLVAGQLLPRQSVLVGESAARSLEFWTFDIAFLSAEAANRDGLWNSQEIIVRQQLVAATRARRVVYCLDRQKFGSVAPCLLQRWADVDCVLTDAPSETIRSLGLPRDRCLAATQGSELPSSGHSPQALPVHYL